MAEQLPDGHQDCRLTLHNGQYHLAVTFNAERRKSETQARVVALDPGIRTFLTWFSEPTPAKSASTTSEESNASANTSTSSSAGQPRPDPVESATCGKPRTA